jgi:hypothetical protein
VRLLLVTGTGRCGTQWIAAALTQAGLPCTHERHWTRRRHGDGNWLAEASWPAAPYTPVPDAYVVHLVRHPLAVIRSRMSGGLFADRPTYPKLAAWMYRQVPEVREGRTELERAALHWVAWNRLVAGAAELLRLEDITPDTVSRLVTVTGRVGQPVALPPPVGSRPAAGPELTWQQVEHIPGLISMAQEYGYR